jgi:hypothetical protein
VAALDLERIAWKLMASKGFSPDWVAQAELEYRRFLHLRLRHPNVSLVPSLRIDEFWHAHILDTRAYARDCEVVFGHFLHHCPNFGRFGDDDQAELRAAFAHTQRLYLLEFGEPLVESRAARCQNKPCHAPTPCRCR